MDGSRPTTFVLEDQALLCAGLHALLEMAADCHVVGCARDPGSALRRVRELAPDLILIDLTLRGISGLDVLPDLARAAPGACFLMVLERADPRLERVCLEGGASGTVALDEDPHRLVTAAAAALRRPAGGPAPTPSPEAGAAGMDDLTAREHEVLDLLAAGCTNREVAGTLGIALGTVRKHRENLQRKLGCHSVAGLTRLSMRAALFGDRGRGPEPRARVVALSAMRGGPRGTRVSDPEGTRATAME